jgi:ATP-dependent DNA helicase PIF1
MSQDRDKIIKDLIIKYKTNKWRNILVHSPAGTGKSYFIRELAQYGEKCGLNVYKTATTGIAALNIGGTTIHKYAGIGLGDKPIEDIWNKIKTNVLLMRKWRETDILIIDEISMMGAELFTKLSLVAKLMRQNTHAFGGVALILVGDFLQLPPVKDDWVFNSPSYKQLNLYPIVFNDAKRFDDPEYIELLRRIRIGEHTDDDIELIKTRYIGREYNDECEDDSALIEPTVLFSRRIDVDNYNLKKLAELTESSPKTYLANDIIEIKKKKNSAKLGEVKTDEFIEKDIKKSFNFDDVFGQIIPKNLELRVGAQVMLRANLDVKGGLVNGSRGVVVSTNKDCVEVYFQSTDSIISIFPYSWECETPDYIAVRKQIPLILAWGLTIHKSQGTTLDKAIINLDDIFEDGMAYVSLSRVRNLKSLYIIGSGVKKTAFRTNTSVLCFLKEQNI